MLNFDMVSSPKFVRFVYEGDGSGTGTVGPNGSDVIEDSTLRLHPMRTSQSAAGPVPRKPIKLRFAREFGLQVAD